MILFHWCYFFFFNDTATTEIYTLSLHDALPILPRPLLLALLGDHLGGRPRDELLVGELGGEPRQLLLQPGQLARQAPRSEEHTSELQSPCNLVCRLLLEKKKKHREDHTHLEPHAP